MNTRLLQEGEGHPAKTPQQPTNPATTILLPVGQVPVQTVCKAYCLGSRTWWMKVHAKQISTSGLAWLSAQTFIACLDPSSALFQVRGAWSAAGGAHRQRRTKQCQKNYRHPDLAVTTSRPDAREEARRPRGLYIPRLQSCLSITYTPTVSTCQTQRSFELEKFDATNDGILMLGNVHRLQLLATKATKSVNVNG